MMAIGVFKIQLAYEHASHHSGPTGLPHSRTNHANDVQSSLQSMEPHQMIHWNTSKNPESEPHANQWLKAIHTAISNI